MTGTDAGFVDAAALDFHLTASSALRNAGTALVPGVPTVLREYVAHLETTARFADGPLDLGAFERCDSDCTPATQPDGGVGPGSDGGSGPGSGSRGGCGCSTGGAGPDGSAGIVALVALLALARSRFRRESGPRPTRHRAICIR